MLKVSLLIIQPFCQSILPQWLVFVIFFLFKMQENSDKMTKDLKWTYMGHLAKIETWLSTASQDLDNSAEISKGADEIEESCSHVIKNFHQTLVSDMPLEKRITVVLSTTNILLRIYTINKSSVIKTTENLQSTISIFTDNLVDICQTIVPNGENDTRDLSDSLSTKPADDIRHSKYAANIFDSLLTNFAQDALLKRCLDSLFSNKASSREGKIVYNLLHLCFYGNTAVTTRKRRGSLSRLSLRNSFGRNMSL